MKVRDIRDRGWFWAQNELFDVFLPLIGVHGMAVYMAMCRLLEDPKAKTKGRLSVRHLARASRVSKSEVQRARTEMVALGMIAEKTRGPKKPSAFELLDLRAAAEVGPEELKRRHSLVQRPESKTVPKVKVGTVETVPWGDSSQQNGQHLRGSPDLQTPLPGSVPGTVVSPDGGQSAPVFNSLNSKQHQEENARAQGPLELADLAGLIVLAHPRAKLRKWTSRDILIADRVAVMNATHVESERSGDTPEATALTILNQVERIASGVPREQWRFLKEIEPFFRLREYRMEPKDLYSQRGPDARTQSNQPNGNSTAGPARLSPAVQRGLDTRQRIDAAVERRIAACARRTHGTGASSVSKPRTTAGHGDDVPGGVGGDGPPLWIP